MKALLQSGTQFAIHFNNLFSPFQGEHNLEASHPDAAVTIRNMSQYQSEMEELRMTLSPELELIESRVVGPVKELQAVMKLIRKNITKRDHKVSSRRSLACILLAHKTCLCRAVGGLRSVQQFTD